MSEISVRRVKDGARERVHVELTLPGVRAAAELKIVIKESSISVHVPGRYDLVRSRAPPSCTTPALRWQNSGLFAQGANAASSPK